MKNNVTILVLSLATLIVGAALEELLPKWLGVGFPVLLALAILNGIRGTLPVAVIYAIAAAGFEDSLSSLPYLTSVLFFLGAAALARWTRLGWLTMLVAFPAYQLWLAVWLPGYATGALFVRFLLSIPVGVMTSLATGVAFLWLERRAAVA